MGNGAKAASKRERNAKDAGNVAKSQLKSVRFFFFGFRKRSARLFPVLPRKNSMASHTQCTNAYIQNILAKSIKCKICFQDFQSTAKRPALEEHASNKHSKKYEDCFPAAA
jgi:hypothetical protein